MCNWPRHVSDTYTSIGLGVGTVMRAPTKSEQMDVLSAAYDAGIRHFDVAPSYGLGHAETLLGAFVKRRPDALVATKVGIRTSRLGRAAGRVQGPIRSTLRALPKIRRLATKVGASTVTSLRLSAEEVERSVDASLSRLGLSEIPLLLVHETSFMSGGYGTLECLLRLRDRGRVCRIGVSGPAPIVQEWVSEGAPLDVVQVEWTTDAVVSAPGISVIRYGVIASVGVPTWSRLYEAFADNELVRSGIEYCRSTGHSGVQTLLALSMMTQPMDILLAGCSTASHARELGPAKTLAASLLKHFSAGAVESTAVTDGIDRLSREWA